MSTKPTETEQIASILGSVVDEYLDQRAAGNQPDIDAFAERHPDLADLIRSSLRALDVVGDKWDSGDGGAGESPVKARKQLGDFRILRELGSGGMGFVYEAEQLSMGRHVALKILPMAGALQEKSLQRFRNEVRAASMLDHPNIVSIYSVGEDRGVHYYAMQLIRGQSLARVIEELSGTGDAAHSLNGDSISQILSPGTWERSKSAGEPTEGAYDSREFDTAVRHASDTRADAQACVSTLKSGAGNVQYYRSVARLGIQAAEALQHAHDLGVLHRDIKPGNLMLDASTNLHITDFGLARIEADAGMTMTGDLVGTLRYMSPEQALAKRVVIDHRCDIYSLGMTLYELIALRPAFESANRQELLNQIAFDEPLKLRKRDRSVPQELATIVHKTIEKDPLDRYTTAVELAEDLRAFLDDRPIQAKPPTPTQRLARWSRCHRPLIVSAATCLLLLMLSIIGVLAISNSMISAERSEKSQALNDREEALKAADENLQMALQAVNRMLTRVGREELRDVTQVAPVRLALLEDAVEFYLQLLENAPKDPRLRFEVARSLVHLARQSLAQDNIRESLQVGFYARNMLNELFKSDPSNPDYLAELARINADLGTIYSYRLKRKIEAEPYIRSALAQRNELRDRWPDTVRYRDVGLGADYNLSNVLRNTNRPQEAFDLLCEGADVAASFVEKFPHDPAYLAHQARTIYHLARLSQKEDRSDAEDLYRQAMELQQTVVNKSSEMEPLAHHDAVSARHYLRATQSELAAIFESQGRDQEAEAAYRTVFMTAVSDANRFPRYHSTWDDIYNSYRHLGRFLVAKGRHEEAEQIFRQLWVYLQEGVRIDASELNCKHFVISCKALVQALEAIDRSNDVDPILQTTVDLLSGVVARVDQERHVPHKGGATDTGLSELLGIELEEELLRELRATDDKRNEETRNALFEAMALQMQYGSKPPDLDALRGYFHPRSSADFLNRGHLYREFQRLDEAVDDYTRAIELNPGVSAFRHRAGIYRDLGQYKLAVADLNRAIELTPRGYLFKRRGLAHFHLAQFDSALSDIATAIREKPSDPFSLTWISPQLVAACPDDAFRDGMVELADRMLELNDDDPLRARLARLKFFKGLGSHGKAAKEYEAAIQLNPDDPSLLNNLAWMLATTLDSDLQDPERAVELARKATELSPDHPPPWNTLGVAQYRVGKFDASITTLRKSMEFTHGGNAWDWFFLSMAHARLGDLEQAKQRYDQAVTWMEKHDPDNEELMSFRAEAEQLMQDR